MELDGRTALVTGGTSDIGAAIVRALARRGANVAIHCHHNAAGAQALAAEHTLGRRCCVSRRT
jgi:3-oxoacyl-[acyl-carrier protein] reductase